MTTTTLYRPVDSQELALIKASGWREFPPLNAAIQGLIEIIAAYGVGGELADSLAILKESVG
jgi:hypothetical protein